MYKSLKYLINYAAILVLSIYSFSCCLHRQVKAPIENQAAYKSTVFVLVMPEDMDTEGEDPYQLGSGVAISGGEYVLTAAHVCEYESGVKTRIEAVSWKGNAARAEIIKVNRYYDLCLLKISAKFPSALIAIDEPEIGDKLYASGYPLAYYEVKQPLLLDGYYSGVNPRGIMLTTIPVAQGSSGGAVFNQNGEIVGILISEFREFENISFSASLRSVNDFLNIEQ